MKKVLTIAGSDSCGGAGIQADLKTFAALKVYGMSVITSVTAQNTQGVLDAFDMSEDMIEKQLDVIFTDIEVDAVKIGMLSNSAIIDIVAKKIKYYGIQNVVLDPVMVSKSGYLLLKQEAVNTLIKSLLPLSLLITPNIFEAEVLLNRRVEQLKDVENAAKDLYQMTLRNVLIKGGHLEGDAVDVLYDGNNFKYFRDKRISTKHTHGTGCTLSSAIAAYISHGFSLEDAIKKAKEYVTGAIRKSISLGKGVGPLHHLYQYYEI